MTLATRFSYSGLRKVERDRPLTEIEMREIAPSIFAAEKHESRSERYAYVPTIDVLGALSREGFLPFMVCQSSSRVPGKADFTKHLIRMRHGDKIAKGGSPEIILLNSHDGTSSFQLKGGWFEFVCQNGLIRGTTGSDIRIHHKGDIIHDVVEGAYSTLKTLENVTEQRGEMLSITLNRDERLLFADAAMHLRFGKDEHGNSLSPVPAERLLQPARREEMADAETLWRTLNITQERVMRGGQRGIDANKRRVKTREVKSIDRGNALNEALWILAEGMAKLKRAA